VIDGKLSLAKFGNKIVMGNINNSLTCVSATSQINYKHTLIYTSFNKCARDSCERYCYTQDIVQSNTTPLPKLYNQKIIEHGESKYIIFCHDDVSLEDPQLYEKIDKAIGNNSEFAICGVAGSKECVIKNNNLWHVMNSTGKPFYNCSGAVAHYTGKDDTECFMSNFGTTPARVILLDGVFLAVNVEKINKVGLRFDEDNPTGFHFYDLLFCLDANKLGLKMTTVPIWLVHKSHGLNNLEDEEWNKGNEYFKKKWK